MANGEKVIKKLKALWEDKRSYTARLWLSGAVMLAFAFTIVFFGPLEMVAFSGDSLPFGYWDVFWLLLGAMVAVTAIFAPLLALLRGRIFNYSICVTAAVVLGGYVQAMVLNGGLGLLTGDGIDWSSHMGSALWGLLLWAMVLIALLLGMYLNRSLWSKVLKAVCLVLVFMQLVPAVAILCGVYDTDKASVSERYYLSDEGFYEFSPEENVLVFVLDRLDYDYLEQALARDPDFLEGLEGFTAYTNAISGFARTRPALTHMLTGAAETAFQVSAEDYFSQSWEQDGRNLLRDLQQEGFRTALYANIRNLFSKPAQMEDYVENLGDSFGDLNSMTVLKKLMQLSAYRYAPIALKPVFWADTNYYNEGMRKATARSAYQFNDALYAAGFENSTAQKADKCFKLYHFFGPHAPYTMLADGTAGEKPTTVTEQTIGSFANLIKIFNKMKELGIYDNATIVITGDHGAAVSDLKPLQKATRVGLFYKRAGASGPLKYSDAPVTTDQVAATVIKAAGGDHSAYGPALDEVAEDAKITRVYYKTVCDPETYRETELCVYHVTGDAADFANWELVEQVPIPYSYN